MGEAFERLSFLIDSLEKGVAGLKTVESKSNIVMFKEVKELILKVQKNLSEELNELSKN
jgi:hypothetical protein